MLGCLLIWNDCVDGKEDIFEAWYREEHFPERMSVPGFLCGIRHQAIDGGYPRFFTYYVVKNTEVLSSEGYRKLLEKPTPRTTYIMADVFKNMSRTICELEILQTGPRSVYAVTATGDEKWLAHFLVPESAPFTMALRGLPPREPTVEEQLRGGDDHVQAAVVLHFRSANEAKSYAAEINGRAWEIIEYAEPNL